MASDSHFVVVICLDSDDGEASQVQPGSVDWSFHLDVHKVFDHIGKYRVRLSTKTATTPRWIGDWLKAGGPIAALLPYTSTRLQCGDPDKRPAIFVNPQLP